jgi:hypothetical protein
MASSRVSVTGFFGAYGDQGDQNFQNAQFIDNPIDTFPPEDNKPHSFDLGNSKNDIFPIGTPDLEAFNQARNAFNPSSKIDDQSTTEYKTFSW